MSDFTLQPPVDYIAQLLDLIPEFRNSPELRSLDDDERTTSGLVFSAFTRYMESAIRSQDEATLGKCLNSIEHFASTGELEAENLLVTEVFENFVDPQSNSQLLHSRSRTLYDRWMGS